MTSACVLGYLLMIRDGHKDWHLCWQKWWHQWRSHVCTALQWLGESPLGSPWLCESWGVVNDDDELYGDCEVLVLAAMYNGRRIWVPHRFKFLLKFPWSRCTHVVILIEIKQKSALVWFRVFVVEDERSEGKLHDSESQLRSHGHRHHCSPCRRDCCQIIHSLVQILMSKLLIPIGYFSMMKYLALLCVLNCFTKEQ